MVISFTFLKTTSILLVHVYGVARANTMALFGWRGKWGKRGKRRYILSSTSKHEDKRSCGKCFIPKFPLPLFECQIEVKLA